MTVAGPLHLRDKSFLPVSKSIRIHTSPGLGYHVHRDLIERWTTEKETWRAR